MEQGGIWSATHEVSASEVDLHRRMTLPSLARLLQVTAGDHAIHRQLGFDDMQAHGQVWVLNRLKVEITRMPAWREQLKIETWVRDMKGPFSHRDFRLLDAKGELLAAAGTLWIAIDAQTLRPQRLGERAELIPSLPERQALNAPPARLPAMPAAGEVILHEVRYSDLDMVGHTNNVRYIEWVLDTYPLDHYRQQEIAAIEVNYLGETRAGDQAAIYRQPLEDGRMDHLISLDDKEVCRLRLQWRSRSTDAQPD